MSTFQELLNQTAFSVLEPNQQSTTFQQQDQLLENSLIQVRKEIAQLNTAIQTQEVAFNPVIELKESLALKQKMEQEIWVQIQQRQISTAIPSAKGSLVMVQEAPENL